jgi:hypothetical protein
MPTAAEEAKPFDFKLRYAVVLDNAEPFKGEVTCWSNQGLRLVDHKTRYQAEACTR